MEQDFRMWEFIRVWPAVSEEVKLRHARRNQCTLLIWTFNKNDTISNRPNQECPIRTTGQGNTEETRSLLAQERWSFLHTIKLHDKKTVHYSVHSLRFASSGLYHYHIHFCSIGGSVADLSPNPAALTIHDIRPSCADTLLVHCLTVLMSSWMTRSMHFRQGSFSLMICFFTMASNAMSGVNRPVLKDTWIRQTRTREGQWKNSDTSAHTHTEGGGDTPDHTHDDETHSHSNQQLAEQRTLAQLAWLHGCSW